MGRKLYERRAHRAAAAPLCRMDATYTRLASDGSRKLGGLRVLPIGSASRLACPSHRLRIAQRLSPKSILIVTLSSRLTPPSPEYLRCPGKTTARRSRGWHGEARLLRHLEQCSPAQIERERIGRWEWRRRIGRSFRGGGGRLGRDPELCGVVPVPAT